MKPSALLRAILLACSVLLPNCAFAGSATWNLNPTSGDWNTAGNWTPATVPNGPADTATFGTSTIPAVSFSGFIETNSIVFDPGASAFTITVDPAGVSSGLTISGAGISNNSGISQSFVAASDAAGGQGAIGFANTASAGTATFTNKASPVVGLNSGITQFVGDATAGNALFICEGGVVNGGAAGRCDFFEHSSGDNATFVNQGGLVAGARGGITQFLASARGGHATLIANGGTNGGGGGQILFWNASKGENVRVQVFGNGFLDLSQKTGLSIGSLEGDGLVHLVGHHLTVGRNNLSTTFSGVIDEGDFHHGSFSKEGTGKLTLSGANTYSGSTEVKAGSLVVNNTTGSGTGSGAVKVNAGTLGGNGVIAGAVTVDSDAFLEPSVGANRPATLTVQSALTFNAGATYSYKLNSRQISGDSVTANGVTITSGAQFDITVIGRGILNTGTIFTAINNTAGSAISGEFANLPDGSTFVLARNKFQVDYEGGDGNDLTLTVVP